MPNNEPVYYGMVLIFENELKEWRGSVEDLVRRKCENCFLAVMDAINHDRNHTSTQG